MTISSTKPRRGEIWAVRFDPSVGAEIQKIRPAVVMNIPEAGRLPLVIVVPITHWKEDYEDLPWFVPLPLTAENGLSKESGADAFQVKSVSVLRCVRHMGRVTDRQLEEIADAIAFCVGFTP